MQVVEKSSEGLSKVLQVTIPAKDLTDRLDAKIKEVSPRINLKGFRPGKVPAAHVRKVFGRDLMGEIVNETVNESSQQALNDANIRPAAPADVTFSNDLEKVVKGEADLAYEMAVEVMPDFDPIDPSTVELSRPTYTPSDADIDETMGELLSQSKSFGAKAGKAAKAESGDMVVIDFVGRVDGEAFAGGTASDAELVLGSGQFIPGFEEQLIGTKAGDEKVVTVTFPEDYQVANLAGQPAEFTVEVKEVRAPQASKADDAFATRMGFESLDALKNAVVTQLEQQYGQAARFKMKRRLLDVLDAKHAFTLPPKMVEQEFGAIWSQVDADRKAGQLPPEDAGKSEKELKDEYRAIAERRVRLGLVLAELGRRNGVTVSDQELSNAVMNEARKYPGQEKEVFEYFRSNPNAAAQLRAPIYEEKVCDWIFSVAKVTDAPVSKEELFADEDEEPKPAKKAAAKKGKSEAKAEAAPAAEAPAKAEKPAKKAAAKAETPPAEAKAEKAPAKKAPAKKK